jgi:hypothetical protein
MGVLTVPNFRDNDWLETGGASAASKHYCEQLEFGHILLFTETPFPLNAIDRQFLLDVRQSSARYHKNISYRPGEDRIRGIDRYGIDVETLRDIMRTYSRNVSAFVRTFLSPYAKGVRLDFASFRPIEEQGRKMPLNARNDLVHVDAFPTRPTNGDRILRVFTNIHPTQPRRWVTGDTFDILAAQMAADCGLSAIARHGRSSLQRALHQVSTWFRKMGLRVKHRSPYDRFMLLFHDYLKQNDRFQKASPKYYSSFAPNSTWLVYTDMVPHAVLFGQFALEHTFIVSRSALLWPECAPIHILESLAGVSLTHTTSLRAAA